MVVAILLAMLSAGMNATFTMKPNNDAIMFMAKLGYGIGSGAGAGGMGVRQTSGKPMFVPAPRLEAGSNGCVPSCVVLCRVALWLSSSTANRGALPCR